MKELDPRVKLWLNSANVQGAFGDGKWRLLLAIGSEGSLQAASRLLRISYRKAWGDLQKTQAALGIRLVEKQRGGSKGGQTVLTAVGKSWVEAYMQFRQDVEKAIAKAYRKHLLELTR
ncbi:MAG: LysR family transcriptional regulator [Sedimentisphaerales bacterium]|nr:LysR family transcriptional regulator [Sedimentisphaerales bacterium]